MTPVNQWSIPGRIWAILLSWGLAVLGMGGLGAYWMYSNDREQDRTMCVMLDLFVTGPPPAAGPAGDRGREIVAAMTAYQQVLDCDDLLKDAGRR